MSGHTATAVDEDVPDQEQAGRVRDQIASVQPAGPLAGRGDPRGGA